MVQRYEQTRKLQWYKRGAAYFGLRTELNRKLALFGWGAENLFFMSHRFHRFTQIFR